ncbi:hypothetical protein [Microbacterium phyllosphaerae]|uniref:hypothetical protein n=1 Tax=Microbacterium phyllosphaerae TaxID=124798 RepID=UPI003D656E2A
MTTTARHEDLAERVEAAVLATPGVRSLYRAGSLISNLVGTSAVALGISRSDEPLVAVRISDDAARVEASLGIEYSAGAIDTLREVRAVVERTLTADGLALADIVLTIAYVHPREASSD